MDRRSWALLILLAGIWGASYMLIKIGLEDLSPAMVAWLRVLLAALVLVPLALARGALAGLGGAVAVLVLVAAVQVAGPFLLIALGELEVSSALAGILVATAPIFTAILAIWLDHAERSHGLRLVGIGVGMAGVVLLFGLDLGDSRAALLGGLAIVLAGLGYAVGGFVVKRRLAGLDPLGTSAAVMIASTVLLAPAGAATLPSELPGVGPIAAVTALGAVGTGFAFVVFYGLIAHVGPARSLLVAYLAPGFAVLYGTLLLGEDVGVTTVTGLTLILAGSWLAAEGRLPLRTAVARPPLEQGGGAVPVLPEVPAQGVEDR